MISYRSAMCFVVALGLTSVAAMGQAGGSNAMLPSSFRNEVAFGPEQVKAIDAWVAGQVGRLAGTDATAQQQARDTMISNAAGAASYQDAYAASLNTALAQVLKGNDFRARLNAAVVAARVAEKVPNARLHDVALQMIGDQNQGIVLWGLKTAKSVVPQMFAAQGAGASPDLINAASQAAVARAEFGPIVAEAYQVLAPKVTEQTANLAALVKATYPPLMKLMATRNQVYVAGMPPEPSAEGSAAFFISFAPVWNALTPEQKVQGVQQLSDLVGLAGQRWSPTTRDQIAPLWKPLAGALQVISGQPDVKSTALGTAAAALARVNASTQQADVQKAVAAIHPAIVSVPAFKSVTPPPTVQPVAAPATATAPGGAAGEPATAKSTQ